jgi:hypothetical protein
VPAPIRWLPWLASLACLGCGQGVQRRKHHPSPELSPARPLCDAASADAPAGGVNGEPSDRRHHAISDGESFKSPQQWLSCGDRNLRVRVPSSPLKLQQDEIGKGAHHLPLQPLHESSRPLFAGSPHKCGRAQRVRHRVPMEPQDIQSTHSTAQGPACTLTHTWPYCVFMEPG